jgi:hypothetical protein
VATMSMNTRSVTSTDPAVSIITSSIMSTKYTRLQSVRSLALTNSRVSQLASLMRALSADEDAETGVHLEPCVNDKVTVRGSAIYRIASYLNHSCDPNVMALYPHLVGHATAFVAGKPIKKDEELFYRYLQTISVGGGFAQRRLTGCWLGQIRHGDGEPARATQETAQALPLLVQLLPLPSRAVQGVDQQVLRRFVVWLCSCLTLTCPTTSTAIPPSC